MLSVFRVRMDVTLCCLNGTAKGHGGQESFEQRNQKKKKMTQTHKTQVEHANIMVKYSQVIAAAEMLCKNGKQEWKCLQGVPKSDQLACYSKLYDFCSCCYSSVVLETYLLVYSLCIHMCIILKTKKNLTSPFHHFLGCPGYISAAVCVT